MIKTKFRRFLAGIFLLCLMVITCMAWLVLSTGPVLAENAKEVKRYGLFIAYSDGTVLDGRTNLMWAAKDNGSNLSWQEANQYCSNYRGGGHTDWRMPTLAELTGLYASGAHREIITLTGPWVWAGETRDNTASYFLFNLGLRYWIDPSYTTSLRALPVRTGK